MLMNKIGASCGPFNCVKVHWSVHTIVNVTKKTLETTLAGLCWIVKTAPSSLAVNRKFVRWEPQESQFSQLFEVRRLETVQITSVERLKAKETVSGEQKLENSLSRLFSITQQDFTTKEVVNATLFVLINAWSVSRELQQHAFSEESTIYAFPLGRSETAPHQRGCDSS